MKKDSHKTKVCFLVNETNETPDLFAFFPKNIEGQNECGDNLYLCYSQIGQHSSAMFEYAAESRNAKPEEYQNLKTELEGLGYYLEIIKLR